MRLGLSILVLGGFVLTLACERKKPEVEMTPDMYESTSFKAQKEDPHSADGAIARVPPEGTVPRSYEPYKYEAFEGEKAGKELKNYLPRTKANLERGKKIYNTYCIVCHGPKGNGEGFVVPPYPRPPSLLSEKVTKWPDGNIFHVITKGQNLMPSYAVQVEPLDRWAIVHYIRALQRADSPTPDDLKELGSKK